MNAGYKWVPAQVPYLEELYTFTASRHVPLVLLGDWPELHRWGYSCIPTAWSASALDRCKYEREPNFRGVDYTAYQELAAAHADIYTFSLYDLLTDGDTVGAVVPGTDTMCYFDSMHLTKTASEYLGPFICSFMTSSVLI
mmetsp:Transcript_53091/g.127288  ORF Transcript_53091/g.127288 Transcript_53091/m.127288 type:complete len:140 (-) Transcript_53091:9-428(-)